MTMKETELQVAVEQSQDWESIVSTGMEAKESIDSSRFVLGDLASKVETIWGKDMINEYAKAIGIEKRSLQRYRDVSRKIPSELREEFRHMSWSHFRLASGQIDPRKWIEKASDEQWSVELLSIRIKEAHGESVPPIPKVKMVECPYCRRVTLIGPPELVCANFHDCGDQLGQDWRVQMLARMKEQNGKEVKE